MGRAPCCSKVGLNRGPWTPEEDTLLSKYIDAHGEGNWRALPKAAGLLRCGKSCRLRWVNYLRPNVKRGNISEDEEDLIVMLHALLGNRWSLIAARMPGRTDNEIKNYWNTHLSKKLASKGLDPKTHKPIVSSPPAAEAEAEAPAAVAAKNKFFEGSTSSSSSSSHKQSDEEHPQEAWETTMDLDTCSYSTGSYAPLVNQKQQQRKSPLQRKKSQLLRHSMLLQETGQNIPQDGQMRQAVTNEQSFSVKVPTKGTWSASSLFACGSPSSVLNFYSPASSDESSQMTNSHSSSSLNSSSQHSEQDQECSPLDGMESCWEELSNNDAMFLESVPPTSAATQTVVPTESQQMLQLIDDFLCSNKEEPNIEFWDSLERIEPPTSLWDGLGDIATVVPAATTMTMTTNDDLLQQTSVSQTCGFHESISELLFAC